MKDIRTSLEAGYEAGSDGLPQQNSGASNLAALSHPIAREADCAPSSFLHLLFSVVFELPVDVLVAAGLIVMAAVCAGVEDIRSKRLAVGWPGLCAGVRLSLRIAGVLALIWATWLTVCFVIIGDSARVSATRRSFGLPLRVAQVAHREELRFSEASSVAR